LPLRPDKVFQKFPVEQPTEWPPLAAASCLIFKKQRGEHEDLCESSTKQLEQNCQVSVPESGESSESLEGCFKGCRAQQAAGASRGTSLLNTKAETVRSKSGGLVQHPIPTSFGGRQRDCHRFWRGLKASSSSSGAQQAACQTSGQAFHPNAACDLPKTCPNELKLELCIKQWANQGSLD
jgi:hypothetical protein